MVAFEVDRLRAATRNYIGSVCVMQITFDDNSKTPAAGAKR